MSYDPNQSDPDPAAEGPQPLPPSAAAVPGPNDSPGNAWFDNDEAQPRTTGRPRSTRSWIAGGVVAAVIAGGAVFGINAVSSHSASSASQTSSAAGGLGRFGMGTRGTITAINGKTITVKTSSGTTKVTTATSTTVSMAKAGTVSDIATGDQVMVLGTTSGTKIAATQIIDTGKTGSAATGQAPAGFPGGGAPPNGAGGAPSGGTGPPTSGTVIKVSGSTITVKGTDGKTYTVSSGSTTTVAIEATGSLSDLATGDTVQVMGRTGSGGAVTAARIVDGAAGVISGVGTGGPPVA